MAPIYKAIYRKSDNVFVSGGFDDRQIPHISGPNDPITGLPTQVPDTTTYGIAEFGDADVPDIVLDRCDPLATPPKRRATAQELANAADAKLTADSALTSRQKDVLTTCALVVRSRNVAAWNAMTVNQKKTATLAEADVLRDLRVWMGKNT